MPVDYEKFDGILLSLLGNMEGGIDDLFDLIFNFLNRKSDYFTGMDTSVSRKRLLEVYDKYAKDVEKVCLFHGFPREITVKNVTVTFITIVL